ncbi:hypothetical protein LTR95_011201 [Oleoguttula sp. CCFEE 5521]
MFSLSTTLALSALALRVASAADVFAHFMVMNAYAYDVDQWKKDMSDAQQIGIDGFALNWIPPYCQGDQGWTADRIGDAFTAAEQMGFKLAHSFDMSYSECNTYWTPQYMAQILTKYASNLATYRWNGDILVTTYGGDFVSQYGNDFFNSLKAEMSYSNQYISLSPALTKYSMAGYDDPSGQASQLLSDFPSIDGYLNWQAWPLNVQENITATPDQAFQSALKNAGKKGPYIMSVSPWQYKDLNNGNPLDAWVAFSDTLFPDRFAQLTNKEVQPDIIEILTWNDFCESHYLRDLPDQHDTSAKDYVVLGDMGNYVWGQNHAPWRIIAKYYISWWKSGSPPPIIMDQVIYWYRVHPKDASCYYGSSTAIKNANMPADAMFAWALVKDSATISMTVGSNQYHTFTADGSGPAMGQVPFPSDLGSGVTPEVAIVRNGQTIYTGKGSQTISSSCQWQNFNPNVNLVGDGTNQGTVGVNNKMASSKKHRRHSHRHVRHIGDH